MQALGGEVVHALAVVLRLLDDKMPTPEALARLGRHSHLPMPLQTAVLLLLQARCLLRHTQGRDLELRVYPAVLLLLQARCLLRHMQGRALRFRVYPSLAPTARRLAWTSHLRGCARRCPYTWRGQSAALLP